MKSKYLPFLLILFTVSGFQKVISQTASIENVEANPGEAVLVPIDFAGMTNLGAITLFVHFDTTVLTYTGITNLCPEGNGTISYFDPENSRVGFSWIAPGMSGVDFPDGKYLDMMFQFHGGYTELIFPEDCEFATFEGTILQTDYINGSVSAPSVTFNIKVFLEGAYEPGSGGEMSTVLNAEGLLPGIQPFAPALPYFGNNEPVWLYNGDESVAIAPDDAVDWLLVELRDAPTAQEATSSTIVARKPCFLLKDGSVVDLNGNTPVIFYASFNQGAFVVIWHRNHLGIMSSNAVPGLGGTYVYDFTTGADKIAGGDAGYKELETGIWGMAAGDINADKSTDIDDKATGWSAEAGVYGYYGSDINLDGQTDNPDKNEILISNFGKQSGVPD